MSDRIADTALLKETLSQADSIVVVEGLTYDHRNRKNNKIIARSNDPMLVASAVEAIDPDFTAERRYWMTPGRPTIAFLQGRELVTTITCLNFGPCWVRCDRLWEGAAPLRNGRDLLDLLVVLASQTIRDRLDSHESPDSIAQDVKWRFDLSPAWRIARTLSAGGLPLTEAHAAARSTMTEEELQAHIQLNESVLDAMEAAAAVEAVPELAEPTGTSAWMALQPDRAAAFEQQAQTEIAPGHELHGVELQALRRCPSCDDALFKLPDESFAIVHLTWKQGPDIPPFPRTVRLPGFLDVESAIDHHEH